jgi:hypothetical protein
MAIKTQPKSWEYIAAFYQDLNNHGWGHERMLALVQYILSSGASQRLFAYTSLDKLIISNHEPLEDSEILCVDFDRQKQLFHFEYFASSVSNYGQEQPEFHRHYLPDVGIEKFDQFLRWIRW